MKNAIATCVVLTTLSGAPAMAEDWSIYADYLTSSNKDERDIDVFAITLARPLRTEGPFTFGVQGGFLSASGRSTENGGLTWSNADAFAAYAGGFGRLSPPSTARFTPFLEVGIAAMITDRSFPDDPSLTMFDGRIYGKFDARLGIDVAVSDTLQLEAAFALNHISNATGLGPQNINFDGAGFSLGIKRRW